MEVKQGGAEGCDISNLGMGGNRMTPSKRVNISRGDIYERHNEFNYINDDFEGLLGHNINHLV